MSAPVRDRRRDASMALLADLARNAPEPAYAAAARRRTGDPPPPRRTPVRLLLLALVGVLSGAAVADVRADADSGAAVRGRLVGQVQERTAESDALGRRAGDLRREVAGLRDAALARDEQGRETAARLDALELAAAAVPVTGPGVVVTLDDRPAGTPAPAPPRGSGTDDGRVLDRDLQDAVNGLWAAGAEAVSVADLRLTAGTAIRSAGEAVLVDFRPLAPPYVVRAVGDPGRLEAAFVDGPSGRRLRTYAALYGLRVEVTGAADLTLPAGSVPELRAARAQGP